MSQDHYTEAEQILREALYSTYTKGSPLFYMLTAGMDHNMIEVLEELADESENYSSLKK